MKKILFVNVCVRDGSRTLALSEAVLAKLSGTIEALNLEKACIQPLNRESLIARDKYLLDKDLSAPLLKYAQQFADADEIVIATPYWDLSFPSMLKVYLEAVTVCGISFIYTKEGRPTGLCKAKRIIYITTAGGKIGKYNLGFDYVSSLAEACYGIPQTICVKAEGLDIKGADVAAIMKNAITEITEIK